MPGGMGPRHLVFGDANRFYVTGELDNMVRCVTSDNGWHITDEISTLPLAWSGVNTSAAIRLHEGALYISNRGHDRLCRIELNADGGMTSASWTATGGRIPRDFMFMSDAILFAHQEGSGIVSSTGVILPMEGAVCICPDWTTV